MTGRSIVVAGLLLVGCSSGEEPGTTVGTTATTASATTSTSAPPTVESNASYGTVEELYEAVVAAGYDCPQYAERETVTMASEAADCESDTVLLVYPSESTRDDNLDFLKAASSPDNAFLVGPNWIVNSGQESVIDEIRPEMGGVVAHGIRDT